MTLNPTMARRLAIIRSLYGEAVAWSRRPETISNLSVLGFHDAAEMFLQLASEQLGLGEQKGDFMRYWDLLDPGIEGGLSQKEAMRRLNKARVSCKHHGTLPSILDIEAFRATTTNFLKDNTKSVFGVEFDEISLLEFVKCESARASLSASEACRKNHDLEGAVKEAALALNCLIHDYLSRKRQAGRQSPFAVGGGGPAYIGMSMGVQQGSPLERFLEGVSESIGKLNSAVEVLSLGINYRGYARFVGIAPTIIGHPDSNIIMPVRRTVPLTEEEVQFCIEFVIESALSLQREDFSV